MRASLEQSVRESTNAAFAAYLRDSATASSKASPSTNRQIIGDREASVQVEYVHAGGPQEVQIMHLEKVGDSAGESARVEGAERIKTLIPYGTPVK